MKLEISETPNLVQFNNPSSLLLLNNMHCLSFHQQGCVITLHPDGRVEYPDKSPDEATKLFWESLSRSVPGWIRDYKLDIDVLRGDLRVKDAEIAALRQQIEHLQHLLKIAQAKTPNPPQSYIAEV